MDKNTPLHLYRIDIENTVMVLAENEKEAKKIASRLDSFELEMNAAYYDASIVTKVEQIDSYFQDSPPYTSKKVELDPLNKELINMTCKEIIVAYEKRQEETRLKNELDKLQLKFDFVNF